MKKNYSATQDMVAILLGTYQGDRYLADQLDSFFFQTYPNWKVLVSDDGSTDNTLPILKEYQMLWGEDKLSVQSGPRKGLAKNFLSLLCQQDKIAAYYAYADQDDFWEPEKLQRAVKWLASQDQSKPSLYCSRTRFVDFNNREIGFSKIPKKSLDFANAIIQNIASGNTMVFNEAARNLMCSVNDKIDVPFHDWWTYQIVAAFEGNIHYDDYPSVRYRQHGDNNMGMNIGFVARFKRFSMLLDGKYKIWNDRNLAAIQCLYNKLPEKNKMIFDGFLEARSNTLLRRLFKLKTIGVHRQSFTESIALMISAVLKKM